MSIANSGMTLFSNNDNEGNWDSGTDGPDAYNNAIQGTNSESWQVSKNSTETGTLTIATNMGTSKYFTFYMSSNLAPYYTDIRVNVRTDTNNYEQFIVATSAARKISGDFHPIVLQFGQGTITGTLNKTSIADIQIIVNNSASGNIRSVINNWIDAMWYGSSRTLTGTTTSDKLFAESQITDTSGSDRYDGCAELYKGALAFQTDLIMNTTTGNSYSETINFAGGYNTNDAYTISITGTSVWKSTNLIGVDGAKVSVVSSSATVFSIDGGGVSNGGTHIFGSGQNIKNAVFSNTTAITQGACNFENNTINTSGLVTVSSTGTCTNNLFSKGTASASLLLADLSHAPNNTFISDGSNHAVELSSIGSGTMSWSGNTTSYDVGSSGSPVTPTNTGNEDIYVNVAAGTLTINVATGATTPSIRSAGATINVVAGLVNFSFALSPSLTSYEWRLYYVTAIGSMTGAVEKAGEETATADNQSYSYSYSSDQPIAVQIINQPNNDYEESISYYTLGSTNQDVSINLKKDINN